jgi:hypothetical protein
MLPIRAISFNTGSMERRMNRAGLVPLLVAALAGGALSLPAQAAPPTVMPSPGYDARLQEQRAASRAAAAPVAPVVKPAAPRRGKKTPAR